MQGSLIFVPFCLFQVFERSFFLEKPHTNQLGLGGAGRASSWVTWADWMEHSLHGITSHKLIPSHAWFQTVNGDTGLPGKGLWDSV